jgi:alpha-galactosidase/6-phospho-beta-glucosidase family protein
MESEQKKNIYNRAKIYRLVCLVTGKQYIGSTTQNLRKRLHEHKINYKCWKNGKYHYVTSFQIIENENYDIVLIEEFPCDNKEQLHARERYYIETMECVNKYIPTRTIQQYRQANREKLAKRDKQYRQANQEEIHQYMKEYRQANHEQLKTKASEKIPCECGNQISRRHISTHRKTKKHIDLINSIEAKEFTSV